jgi:hypothetical protein
MGSQFSKRKATFSGLVAVMIVALALVTWSRHSDSPVNVSTQVLGAQAVQANASTNGNGSDPKGTFLVSGQAQGVYPGLVVPLPLTLTNPQSFGITVNQLAVTVQSPSSTCTARQLEVGILNAGQFQAENPIPVSISLGKNGTAFYTLQLRMVRTAADACQGATFTLSYGGSAVKS